jgi:hypothetical protein
MGYIKITMTFQKLAFSGKTFGMTTRKTSRPPNGHAGGHETLKAEQMMAS